MESVKQTRRRGYTRVSAKNQVTLTVEALRRSGLRPGDVVRVEAEGPGRIVLVRERDPLQKYAAEMTGVYDAGEVDELRDEWA
jgi:bifunctional DNA-binding transcriptional regulator/antitoxin component of YhaV-PrlF toxin-antitoxin module